MLLPSRDYSQLKSKRDLFSNLVRIPHSSAHYLVLFSKIVLKRLKTSDTKSVGIKNSIDRGQANILSQNNSSLLKVIEKAPLNIRTSIRTKRQLLY